MHTMIVLDVCSNTLCSNVVCRRAASEINGQAQYRLPTVKKCRTRQTRHDVTY